MIKETWTYRSARMKPQHSRMEFEVYVKLHLNGYNVMMDMPFFLGIDPVTGRKIYTVPDLWFRREWFAVYLDLIKLHMRKSERDNWLRDKLTKKHGVAVLSISYPRYSPKEASRIYQEIIHAPALQGVPAQ